jgi:hypothetical protein
MPNPNNNMNMYNQALQINRDLKKRIDRAVEIIDDFIEFDSNFIDEYDDFLHGLKEYLNGRH